MSLIGLDINGSRARAVAGPPASPPRLLPLDEPRHELPASLSLQNRHAEVGRAGRALCRQLPHLVCDNFLAHLGTPHAWNAGRHRLDATRALTIFFEHLRTPLAVGKGLLLALPPYLNRTQTELLVGAAGKARLSYLGSVSAALALAVDVFRTSSWSGPALVLDVDDHAFTASIVLVSAGSAELSRSEDPLPSGCRFVHVNSVILPRLNSMTWKLRLIDGIADRCIRHSRRDPRDSGAAEQMLFDQLDGVLDACRVEQMVEVVVHGAQWCQNLILRPEDVRGFCAALCRHAVERCREVLAAAEAEGVQRILISAAVLRLPGLRDALNDELESSTALIELDADAAARGAHELAPHFEAGAFPRDHLDVVAHKAVAAPTRAADKKKRMFRI